MLNEFWSQKLEKALENTRNRKPEPEPINLLPPLPRIDLGNHSSTSVDIYRVEPVRGHWEVYQNGKFYCSADTKEEAYREIP